MRRTKFHFKFLNGGTIAVYAFNEEDAARLAIMQAEELNWSIEIIDRW